jgi:hypothetical protein
MAAATAAFSLRQTVITSTVAGWVGAWTSISGISSP